MTPGAKFVALMAPDDDFKRRRRKAALLTFMGAAVWLAAIVMAFLEWQGAGR